MDNLWSTSIEKLMIWRTANTKIFERLNLHSKIKGFYKGDVVILIVSNPAQEVRKIKFKIKGNVTECLKKLGQHFPIISHGSTAHEEVFESQYRNIAEVMKNAAESIRKTSTLILPAEFNNFVKLCLLDPKMPQVINEAEKIIEELNKL